MEIREAKELLLDIINDDVFDRNKLIALSLAYNTLEQFESGELVEKTDNWISVDERLPEEKINPVTKDYEHYLVWVKFSENEQGDNYLQFGKGEWWYGGSSYSEYITHWKEKPALPEPPKKESEEEE